MKIDKKTTVKILEGVVEEREKQEVRANLDYHYALVSFAEHGGDDAIAKTKDEIQNIKRFVQDEKAKGDKTDKAKVLIWEAQMNELEDKRKGLEEVKKAIRERLEKLEFVLEVNEKFTAYIQKIIASNPMVIYETIDKQGK